jgi:hypothetical protein
MLERTDAITNEVLEAITFVLAYPTVFLTPALHYFKKQCVGKQHSQVVRHKQSSELSPRLQFQKNKYIAVLQIGRPSVYDVSTWHSQTALLQNVQNICGSYKHSFQCREFVTWLNGGAEHSRPSGVEVKNVRSYTQTRPHTFTPFTRNSPFSETTRPALGPTQPPIHWGPGLFPGNKTAGAWRSQLIPSIAEVKNEWSYTSASL